MKANEQAWRFGADMAIAGYEVVTGTSVANADPSAIVSAPTGKVVLGGGGFAHFRHTSGSTTGDPDLPLIASYPFASDKWKLEFAAPEGPWVPAAEVVIHYFVVCADAA